MGTLSPQTELDAVNEMLEAAGETPVGSLTDDVAEVGDALKRLRKESLRVQSRGWYFNIINNRSISPDGNSEILLPSNTIKAEPYGLDFYQPYEMRTVSGVNKLFNTETESFEFSSDVNTRLTLYFDFEELPETAKTYIALRASRRYQDVAYGDDRVREFVREDEQTAFRELKRTHTRFTKRTALDNRHHLHPVSGKWRRGH